MYCLNSSEILLVEKEIKKAEIAVSHLPADLIDHICCDIETLMWEEELSFKEAFTKVMRKIGARGLQKIQEDTLSLTDNSYKIMKNFNKVTGVTAPLLLTIAAYLKIMHWPFASILLILGFFVLCFMFLPSSVFVMYKERKESRTVILYLTGLLGAVLASASVLFKVMHWPGANWLILAGFFFLNLLFMPFLLATKLKDCMTTNEKIMFVTGFLGFWLFETGTLFKMFHWPFASIFFVAGGFLMVLIFFPWYARNRFRKTTFVMGKFMIIVYAGMLLITLNMLLNINVSVAVLDYMAQASQTLQGANHYYQSSNQKNMESILSDTTMTKEQILQFRSLHSKVSAVYNFTEELKKEMIVLSGDEKVIREGERYEFDFYHIENKDGSAARFLLFEQKKIYELKDMLKELMSDEMVNKEDVEGIEIVKVDKVDKWGMNWEQFYFSQANLIVALNNISQIQREVLNLENDKIISLKLNKIQ